MNKWIIIVIIILLFIIIRKIINLTYDDDNTKLKIYKEKQDNSDKLKKKLFSFKDIPMYIPILLSYYFSL